MTIKKLPLALLLVLVACTAVGAESNSDIATIVAQHLLNAWCAAPTSGVRAILTTDEQRHANEIICARQNRSVP